MDAVEFLKENGRMCKAFDSCGGREGSEICELYVKSNEKGLTCPEYASACPEEVVAIVEQWAKEHPRKTRQNELLKIFPNARRWDDIIDLCPQMIENFDCPQKHEGDNWKSCTECKRQYWNAEVKDNGD